MDRRTDNPKTFLAIACRGIKKDQRSFAICGHLHTSADRKTFTHHCYIQSPVYLFHPYLISHAKQKEDMKQCNTDRYNFSGPIFFFYNHFCTNGSMIVKIIIIWTKWYVFLTLKNTMTSLKWTI